MDHALGQLAHVETGLEDETRRRLNLLVGREMRAHPRSASRGTPVGVARVGLLRPRTPARCSPAIIAPMRRQWAGPGFISDLPEPRHQHRRLAGEVPRYSLSVGHRRGHRAAVTSQMGHQVQIKAVRPGASVSNSVST